jgi:hypothetical protein
MVYNMAVKASNSLSGLVFLVVGEWEGESTGEARKIG